MKESTCNELEAMAKSILGSMASGILSTKKAHTLIKLYRNPVVESLQQDSLLSLNNLIKTYNDCTQRLHNTRKAIASISEVRKSLPRNETTRRCFIALTITHDALYELATELEVIIAEYDKKLPKTTTN